MLNIYGNRLYEWCRCCDQQGHTVADCQFVHLVKNKRFTIWKHALSIPQTRDAAVRRRRTAKDRENGPFVNRNLYKRRLKKLRKQLVKELKTTQGGGGNRGSNG